MKFANFDAISQATKQILFPKSSIPLIFRILILILVVLTVSGLGIWHEGYSSDLDYIFIIDASGSMLADDYEPSRLVAAKETAINFVDVLNAQTNVAVISFAGTSFIQQTLTNDKGKIKDAINSIDVIDVGGTAIGDAIVLASNVFKISEVNGNSRAIILLTDGQSNVGVSIEDAIEYSKSNGVVINVLGIGTEEGGNFIDNIAFSSLDSEGLEYLAEQTGGVFYLATSKEEIENAYINIFSSTKTRVFFDTKTYLLMLIFILLLIEGILANTRYKTII